LKHTKFHSVHTLYKQLMHGPCGITISPFNQPIFCLLVKFLFHYSAERESLQYRIRTLESQVTNLENLIEEIDDKSARQEQQISTPIPYPPAPQQQTPVQQQQPQPLPTQATDNQPMMASSFFGAPTTQNAFDSFSSSAPPTQIQSNASVIAQHQPQAVNKTVRISRISTLDKTHFRITRLTRQASFSAESPLVKLYIFCISFK